MKTIMNEQELIDVILSNLKAQGIAQNINADKVHNDVCNSFFSLAFMDKKDLISLCKKMNLPYTKTVKE